MVTFVQGGKPKNMKKERGEINKHNSYNRTWDQASDLKPDWQIEGREALFIMSHTVHQHALYEAFASWRILSSDTSTNPVVCKTLA